ncbi:MAG: acyltransferase family protein [Longimicrobiales bacterium]
MPQQSGTPVIDAPATTVSTVAPPSSVLPAKAQSGSARLPGPESSSERLLSLDVFRGITIASMLLVNNPGTWGAQYAPLKHADWHGWTPTDLIFPFFLFIVGVSMTFSFARMLEKGLTRETILLKSVKRAGLIFLVGLLMHGFPSYIDNLPTLRIPGVLQRIAIAYLIATPIVLYTKVRGIVIAIAALLLGYWVAMTMIPVPGGFPGVLQKGQDLGAFIDRAIFGTNHLWNQSRTWDPEGLLSTFPAVGSALLGVLAGYWIRSPRTQLDKTVGLFVAGNIGLVLGIMWHQLFPINKPLWTSSYVIFTAGMACHMLALCYWLIDVKGYRRWTLPFVIFGMNAIAAFFLSSIGARSLNLIKVAGPDGAPIALKTFIFNNAYQSWLSPINASLAFALTYVLFWLGIMTILYRRRIFIKL